MPIDPPGTVYNVAPYLEWVREAVSLASICQVRGHELYQALYFANLELHLLFLRPPSLEALVLFLALRIPDMFHLNHGMQEVMELRLAVRCHVFYSCIALTLN